VRRFLIPEGGTPAQQAAVAEIIAIHAALVPPGRILYFGGDQHDPGRNYLNMVDNIRLFDCSSLTVSTPSATGLSDFFCCGHAFLPSGDLLIGGGTQYWAFEPSPAGDPNLHAHDGHFRGLPDTWKYNSGPVTFTRVADMNPQPGQTAGGGRWYPTLLTMADGTVLALAGHPSDADVEHFNLMVEAFDEATGVWTPLGTMPYPTTDLYPRAFQLPDGRVFLATPLADGTPQKTCYAFTPSSHSWSPVCAGPGTNYEHFDTTAVLLPLGPEDGYRARILQCGASTPLRIDLGAASPSWQPTGPRTLIDPGGSSPVRAKVNAVILPTGEVAVVGGIRNPGDDPGSAVHEIEVYRHETDSWVTLPSQASLAISRSYHSVALLMPDGRVWVAGSNIFCSWSFHDPALHPGWDSYPPGNPVTTPQDPGIDHRHLEIEIFEPWYVGRPDRPTFALGSSEVALGSDVTIDTPEAVNVSRVVLVRASSATHSFNPDQRHVAVPFSLTSPTNVVAHVPGNPALLPLGPYLLFVLIDVVDEASGAVLSVPSEGTMVIVSHRILKVFKPEIDNLRKEPLDIIRNPKELVDNVIKAGWENYINPGQQLGDPALHGVADVLGAMAQQVDLLQDMMAHSKVFIHKGLRPPVGNTAMPRSFAFGNELIPPDPMRMAMGGAQVPEPSIQMGPPGELPKKSVGSGSMQDMERPSERGANPGHE
jgi:hypothetical protein